MAKKDTYYLVTNEALDPCDPGYRTYYINQEDALQKAESMQKFSLSHGDMNENIYVYSFNLPDNISKQQLVVNLLNNQNFLLNPQLVKTYTITIKTDCTHKWINWGYGKEEGCICEICGEKHIFS